ncbi:hypothetical protein M3661_21145 [Paenibacillus sp. MER 180]|uniref:hypothetical protein n=1 Tax=unclassified Paenibacillus TaxID=185978 RepID=UPI0008065421|nr:MULTISPECIES: hypothetical protein [unclassified Paenibacillus]MCM3292630.1 hypothetical protein [Paenibacillus sp. MER 180]OBY76882.1 hypothetical protein BBG47_24730 [Paenibacillus sp. KS1]
MRGRIALLTVMAALLTCSFFNGPVQAETHTEVTESSAKSQLDSTVLEKVKAALGDIAKGNEMKSDLKVMANASDNIVLEGELSQPAAKLFLSPSR